MLHRECNLSPEAQQIMLSTSPVREREKDLNNGFNPYISYVMRIFQSCKELSRMAEKIHQVRVLLVFDIFHYIWHTKFY